MHELLCSARAAANRITRILTKRVRMKMSAQPYQNDCLLIIKEFVGAAVFRGGGGGGGSSIVRKDTICHVGIITFKIRLRQKIKLEFIIHSIHKYVYMRKQIDAAETQAEPSLLFRP